LHKFLLNEEKVRLFQLQHYYQKNNADCTNQLGLASKFCGTKQS